MTLEQSIDWMVAELDECIKEDDTLTLQEMITIRDVFEAVLEEVFGREV